MINDVIGEKTIDLSYPIHSGREALVLAPHLAVGPRSVEVTVVSMFSNNVLYWLQGPIEVTVVSMFSNNVLYWLQGPIEVLLKTGKKIVLNEGVYTDKELNPLIGTVLKSRMHDHEDVLRTSKWEKVMKMAISLNELNNSDNLEDGHPSDTLFMYHVTDDKDSTRFKPHTPQYRAL